MWRVTLRNVQFRRRQFLLAVVGTALVFAMALLVTGIRQGFRTEAERTLGGIGGDHWAVTDGMVGPFTGTPPVPADTAERLAHTPGVRHVDPLVIFSQNVRLGGDIRSVHVIGHRLGGLGEPPPIAGRRALAPGEAVVDTKLGLGLGQSLTFAGRRLNVVGLVADRTYYGGTPTAYISLADAQAVEFRGAPLITAVVMQGRPDHAPTGLKIMSESQVQADLLRPLGGGVDGAINTTRLLLWAVATVIVGAVLYMSALERVRDFAVLKAVGGSTRALVFGLAFEATVACLAAAGLAVLVTRLLRSTIPLPVTITAGAYATLPVVAVVVGVLASLFGIRRAVHADPALAFSGA
jgi:putative ABC transport system permease protein